MTRLEGVLAAVGAVVSLRIVDVGCGEGDIARDLAQRGAIVSGYDPFISDAHRDWIELGAGRYRLTQAAAEKIPQTDASADVVFLSFPFTIFPRSRWNPLSKEARRLLKPSGKLFVAEPLAEGPGQYVMELYHDETAVRRDAVCIVEIRSPCSAASAFYILTRRNSLSSRPSPSKRSPASASMITANEDVLSPQVRRRFAEMTAAHCEGFDQPVRVNLFAGLGGAH